MFVSIQYFRNRVAISSFPAIIIFAVVFFFFSSPCTANDSIFNNDDAKIAIRTGFSGILWKPGGISPYVLDNYGRGFIHLDVSLKKPLWFLGESFDLIDLPHIRFDTNFGTFSQETNAEDLLVSEEKDISYMYSEIEAVFLDFLSARWQSTRFISELSYPGHFFNSGGIPDGSSGYNLVKAENLSHDLEFGLIGTIDGEENETTLEAGYYIRMWHYPVSMTVDGGGTAPQLFVPDFRFGGIYLIARTEPIPDLWPIFSQFRISFATGTIRTSTGTDLDRLFRGDDERVFQLTGLGAKFTFEQYVYRKTKGGVSFEADYHFLDGSYTAGDGFTYDLSPIETRFKATVYLLFNI
ncbi:MAG: hypothetical protein P9L92_19575 [Candidatus Electryonea clarkiae]|nr:hypothetical protein [Candidatus Electryonea clarkiae]MDP8288991.1 hypothetical protein [Candidatus Electryonea clarkiae]